MFDTVQSSFDVDSSGFTCTSSSTATIQSIYSQYVYSYEYFTCERIYTIKYGVYSDTGWVTEGNGIGSWVKVDFHTSILISKIVYRHNTQHHTKCYNQNFRDVSFSFSDETRMNVTLDDVFERNFEYQISPPLVSSYILLYVNSVYNHSKQIEEHEKPECNKDAFGLSKLNVYGSFTIGDYRKIITLMGVSYSIILPLREIYSSWNVTYSIFP